jgi:hypothetical protein
MFAGTLKQLASVLTKLKRGYSEQRETLIFGATKQPVKVKMSAVALNPPIDEHSRFFESHIPSVRWSHMELLDGSAALSDVQNLRFHPFVRICAGPQYLRLRQPSAIRSPVRICVGFIWSAVEGHSIHWFCALFEKCLDFEGPFQLHSSESYHDTVCCTNG